MSAARPRVGFVTYGLDRPLSGVTRFALELGRALQARDDIELVVLAPYRHGAFVDDPAMRSVFLPGCRLVPGMMTIGGPAIAIAARWFGLDVVHDPVGLSPFTLGRWAGRFGRLVTIHDAIAFEYPRGYPFLNNLLHRHFVPSTLGNVDLVATDSKHAQLMLARFLHLDAERIPVIPLAVSSSFHSAGRDHNAMRDRLGLTSPYVLYVGAFKAHKNVLTLLDAFARAAPDLPDHQLVLVGPSQWSYPAMAEKIASARLTERVRVLGYVDEAVLPAVYGGASAFVMPSLHEGFGLPILEAMACNTPVICSSASSLPEVAGDAAVTIDPRDADMMAQAIVRVCRDEAFANDLRRRGRIQAARFSWAHTAEQYVALYRRLSLPARA
jgi:glycosyltransferase involved in cell wall biosynthesis